MTKIAATEERTLTVRAPLQEVYQFFSDPGLLKEVTADVERFERLGDNKARWTLTEKVEKGVRYLADYTVQYSPDGGNRVTWQTIEGNLETTGEVVLRSIDGSTTEIRYRETVAPDLPISSLTAKLFKPIVAREVRKDIGKFLDRVELRFNGAA